MTTIKKRYPPGADLAALKESLLAKLGSGADMRCEVDPQGYTLVEVGEGRLYRPKSKRNPKKADEDTVEEPVPWGEMDIPSDDEA